MADDEFSYNIDPSAVVSPPPPPPPTPPPRANRPNWSASYRQPQRRRQTAGTSRGDENTITPLDTMNDNLMSPLGNGAITTIAMSTTAAAAAAATAVKGDPNSVIDISNSGNGGNANADDNLSTKGTALGNTRVYPESNYNNSFNKHLMRVEHWGHWLGTNLLAKKYYVDHRGEWQSKGHNIVYLWLVRLFLFTYLVREVCAITLIDADDDKLMLYSGDFSNIYGIHIDRFALTAFKFCWGLHAFVVYVWVTRNNGRARTWLLSFEKRWTDTAYCVNKDLENVSLKGMENSRRFTSYFIKGFTMIATVNITLLSLYGFYLRPRALISSGSMEMMVYCGWSAIHIVWFWMTFVINLTAFGHHYMLCRAIHIRFDETKLDLDYTILSDWSRHTEPEHISKLIAKHYFVCDMVKQANKHLKIYLFIFYSIFAPHLCLMIYQILFASSTTQGRIFIGFLLVISDAFQVYFVSVLSAQITSKSHEPYYAMHGINRFNHLPEDVQLQSTLFMQRLANTVVGLTILDSFVLTGGLISSLITAIVTYFSVILESS